MESYDELMAQAKTLYPGVRIGRPGKSRLYWLTITLMRALRLRYHVRMSGAEHVGDGPAIIVGNHTNFLDPVVVVISAWWRVSAFTKVEWFEGRSSFFFRAMGQIPLRRGDAVSNDWAMAMSSHAMEHGGKIGIYPEGTRSPDSTTLHRLHKRILVPLLQANPDVPVHVVFTRFEPRRRGRIQVTVKLSERLPLDSRTMTAQQLTDMVRDALLEIGQLKYLDRYARDVKAELKAAESAHGSTH